MSSHVECVVNADDYERTGAPVEDAKWMGIFGKACIVKKIRDGDPNQRYVLLNINVHVAGHRDVADNCLTHMVDVLALVRPHPAIAGFGF